MKELSNLIICGCYRSGTSITSIMLSQHPQLLVTDELWYYYRDDKKRHFNNHLKRLNSNYPDKLGKRPFVPVNLIGKRYKEFLELMVSKYPNIPHKFFKDNLIKYSGKDAKYYGDKLPEYVFDLDKFNRDYKNLKVIMCIRDPRDVMCSQVRRYHYFIKKQGSIKTAWWCKKNIDSCIKMRRNWLYFIKSWEKSKDNLDGYELSYRKLIMEPKKEGRRLAEFLGVSSKPMEDIITKNFHSNKLGEWINTYPDINSKLPNEWKDTMVKYGIKL